MDGFIQFLIDALTEFKGYGAAAQLGAVFTLFAAIVTSFWALRKHARETRSKFAKDVEQYKSDAADAEAALRSVQKELEETRPFTADYMSETLPTEIEEGNSLPAKRLAEAYLAHHRAAMLLASETLQSHYLGRYEDGLAGLRQARTYSFGRLACDPGNEAARKTLDLIEAQIRIDAAPPEGQEEIRKREEDDWIRKQLAEAPDDTDTLCEIALHLDARGQYRRAITMWERAEAACCADSRYGRKSTKHLSICHNREEARVCAGDAAEAEAALTALLPLVENVCGAEHPGTLTTRHTLARAQLQQGKAAEAKAALLTLLPLMEKVMGAEHHNTLNTRHELASAQLAQGKAAEAEAALSMLLPLREKVIGPEHPETLKTRQSLAIAQLKQGKAAEAEAALSMLLPLREKVIGPEHPETLATKQRLQKAREANQPAPELTQMPTFSSWQNAPKG